MSDVVQNTQQEFWRPPVPVGAADSITVRESLPTMAEACPQCGTEYLLGSRFCHSCGGRRPEIAGGIAKADIASMAGLWAKGVASIQSTAAGLSSKEITFPAWMRYLHFHEIKRWVGLPTGSLVAFIIGLGCIAGALLVGLLTARTFVDWQAIQFYRGEWLLAATAAFVAGILLKKPSRRDDE